MRALVVTNLHILPYKVLFCLHDAGVRDVYVLGSPQSARLRYTRFCKRVFITGTRFDGSDIENAVRDINAYAKELAIDIVVPGDQHSTRLLTMIRSRLTANCFPLPDAASYNTLYNKWSFMALCRQHHVPYPETALLADAAELRDKIASNAIPYPAICKPLDLEAGNGILKLTQEQAAKEAQRVFYRPILVQQFIEGEDTGASVYCEKGVIKNFVAHSFKRQLYQIFHDDRIHDAIAKILGSLQVSGVFNFDMRLTPHGDLYFLECNPRFFIKMAMSALAGINFVAAGLGLPTPSHIKQGTTVKMPKAFVLNLLTKPYTLSLDDVSRLTKLASDPVPFLYELFYSDQSDVETPINYYLESNKAHTCQRTAKMHSISPEHCTTIFKASA